VVRKPDRVTALLRRLKQDQAVPWWELFSFVGTLAAARLLGYRIVWTIHEIRPHESSDRRQDMLASRALARLSNSLIAHDESTAKRAGEAFGVSAGSIHVIPHGSYVGAYPEGRDRDAVRSELGISRDAFIFLAFGHLRGYKELPLLIEAFGSLASASARLVIAGVPWDATVREAVTRATGNDQRIQLMFGPVPDAGVAELFGAADAAVFPRGDGWTSGSLILAMSMGVPVVAANRDAYSRLMNGDASGWLFEPGSASSLAECLLAAVQDPEMAKRKGEAALRSARQMTWAASAAATARLLDASDRVTESESFGTVTSPLGTA
jgi:glycosyltransferase involved in cell wall biosynthesis